VPFIWLREAKLFLVRTSALSKAEQIFYTITDRNMRNLNFTDKFQMLTNLSKSRIVKEIKSKSSKDNVKRMSHSLNGKLFQINGAWRSIGNFNNLAQRNDDYISCQNKWSMNKADSRDVRRLLYTSRTRWILIVIRSCLAELSGAIVFYNIYIETLKTVLSLPKR